VRAVIVALGFLGLLGAVFASSCSNPPESPAPPVSNVTPVYSYNVINTYSHDRGAFTQGLVFEDGVLYEGTGLNGRSSLRRVDLETGEVLQIYELPRFFGEGITVYGDSVIQLTYEAHVGFVYDKDSFELLREFNYSTQGWGITTDGERLIMSDGSATLYFWDPETFEETGRVEVYDRDGPVKRLNELEYIHGEVYANVWQTNRIARIDPGTGQVVGWIDLSGLLTAEDRIPPVDVLNGIAYDEKKDRLFVTGKLWPKLFEIELVPAG
jgi:glutamine cyclotransferase